MKRLIVTTALLLASLSSARAQQFDFRPGTAAAGHSAVAAGSTYSGERGNGFEPGSGGALFSVKVPEGNYRVSVTLGDAKEASDTTLRAEGGRMLATGLTTSPGEFLTRDFIVNVRRPELPKPPPNAPGGSRVHMFLPGEAESHNWDEKLTLELNGPQPRLARLAIERDDRVPTLFFAGDSTVTDPRSGPGGNWPTHLVQFFKPSIALSNNAEGGETSKSFITGYRFDKVLSLMKAGDFFLIQFGHNDSKANWPQSYTEPETTFKAYLRVFIAETRRRGATPVLVTPMERRANGDSVGPWARAMIELAAQDGVALIDQWSASKRLWTALGPLQVGSAFADPTHLSGYGGYLLARLMVGAIRRDVPALAAHLNDDAPEMDPTRPVPAPAYLSQNSK